MQILVLTIDFDGCSDTLAARELLIDYILGLLKASPNYKKVILMTGSLRQTVWFDFLSAIDLDEIRYKSIESDQYASCSILDTNFLDRLKSQLDNPLTISFDDLLTNDIYWELKKGTTFACMKEIDIAACFKQKIPFTKRCINLQGESVPLFDWTGGDYGAFINENGSPRAVLNKLDICYIQMHYIAQLLGDVNFTYQIMDDRINNLTALESIFSKYPTLIPKNCTFKGVQFAPMLNKLPLNSYSTLLIQGIGQVNKNYMEDMRAIRNACPKTQEAYDKAYFENFSKHFKLNSPLVYLGRVDNSSFQARRPAACPLDPMILLDTQACCVEKVLNGSREQVAGRRDLDCQQTLEIMLNHMSFDKTTMLSIFCMSLGVITLAFAPKSQQKLAITSIGVGIGAAFLKFGIYSHLCVNKLPKAPMATEPKATNA